MKHISARIFAILSAILIALLLAPIAAHAQEDPNNPIRDIGFDQRLDAQVPLDLAFVDEQGRSVTLGDYFGDQPVIINLGYFECPMLCPLVRQGMVDALKEVRLDAGSDFQVVNVSIDPFETPMVAGNTKALNLSRYGRPDTADGWHYLTGTQDSITRLAEAMGFRYVYDEAIDQYAHAAGIVVATPEGKLARYFYGVQFNPSDLRLGLVEASAGTIGTLTDQFLLLCYHYDPVTGQYTGLVMTILRVAGVITILGIGTMIYLLSRNSGQPRGPAQAMG
jgi:protein SCO1/2